MLTRIAGLEVDVHRYELEPLAMATQGGWTRHTTVVHLFGRDAEGMGEDVCYEENDQKEFQARGTDFDLAGRCSLAEFSQKLDAVPMFANPPSRAGNWLYRRWAFESAALDLALRQAGQDLGTLLDLQAQPIRYVVSMSLGDPPDIDKVRRIRALYPDARFKVDLSESWTAATVRDLAATQAIDTVDLKGHYHGWFQGPPPNVEQYRAVAEGLPDAWIEDPWWEGPAWDVLREHRDRITWDANIHSLADVAQLPFRPKCINIKPSRFGFLTELFRTYEYCRNQGIAMYGGGQFELGPGRGQIQYLASLFHANAANDVAPGGFNQDVLASDLPSSPLAPRPDSVGFRWLGDA